MDAGKHLCQTLLLYCNSDLNPDQQMEEIKQYHQRKASSTASTISNTTTSTIGKQPISRKVFNVTPLPSQNTQIEPG